MATGKIFAAALLAASSIPASAARHRRRLQLGPALLRGGRIACSMPTPRRWRAATTALDRGGHSRFRDLVATYVNRGILKLRRGQIEAAIADFDAALRLDPSASPRPI